MTSANRFRVKLRILDEDYALISSASVEHMERLGKMVDQTMREVVSREPRLSAARAAVMSAIMFADQAVQQEQRCRKLELRLRDQRDEVERMRAELSRQSGGYNNRKGRR